MPARVIAPLASPLPPGDPFASRLALVELLVDRGSEPPLQRHRHEDLLIYVPDGELTFHLDGRHIPATTGSLVLIPRGTEHGYALRSDQARLLVILAPAGAEGYLATLHDPDRDGSGNGSAEAVERLIVAAARHGIEITGPPPDLA